MESWYFLISIIIQKIMGGHQPNGTFENFIDKIKLLGPCVRRKELRNYPPGEEKERPAAHKRTGLPPFPWITSRAAALSVHMQLPHQLTHQSMLPRHWYTPAYTDSNHVCVEKVTGARYIYLVAISQHTHSGSISWLKECFAGNCGNGGQDCTYISYCENTV